MRCSLSFTAVTAICLVLGACGDDGDDKQPSSSSSTSGSGGDGGDAPSVGGGGAGGEGGQGGAGGSAPELKADGAPCAADDECSGGLCLTEASFGWAAGYCSQLCAPDLVPCVPGSECLSAGEYSICIKSCDVPGDCTGAGQSCTDLAGDGSLLVCLGGCQSDDQCAGACDADSNLCVASDEACDNGADDDNDALQDCEELDCSANDACAQGVTAACSDAVDISAGGTFAGTTADGGSAFAAICSSLFGSYAAGSGQREKVYQFTASASGVLRVAAIATQGSFDWYIRSRCDDASTLVGCAEPGAPGGAPAEFPVDAGDTLFFFVDGKEGDAAYELQVSFDEEVCGDGVVVGSEACDDGNQAETDACLNDCTVNTVFLCATATPVPPAGTSGDTATGLRGFEGSCAGAGAELVYRYSPSASGNVTITVTPDGDADLVLYARTTCDDASTELDCTDAGFSGDNETITVPVTAGEPIDIFVDSYNADTVGEFSLTVTP